MSCQFSSGIFYFAVADDFIVVEDGVEVECSFDQHVLVSVGIIREVETRHKKIQSNHHWVMVGRFPTKDGKVGRRGDAGNLFRSEESVTAAKHDR